jgi:hypothetical protein
MDERFFELPEAARALVRSILSTIEEAAPLLGEGDVPPELAFDFEQTKARYLPETIAAFLAVPTSQRELGPEQRSPADLLLEQLSVLERAVSRDLAHLAERKRGALEANARFLAERFGDRSTEISTVADAPSVGAAGAPRFAQWLSSSGTSALETVAFVGGRLREHFPAITKVRGRGFMGSGGVEAVSVTLAQGGGVAFRYALDASQGVLEATVTKLVHGTAIQTVRCSAQEWLESLYEDIVEQARRNEAMRAPLARAVEDTRT